MFTLLRSIVIANSSLLQQSAGMWYVLLGGQNYSSCHLLIAQLFLHLKLVLVAFVCLIVFVF